MGGSVWQFAARVTCRYGSLSRAGLMFSARLLLVGSVFACGDNLTAPARETSGEQALLARLQPGVERITIKRTTDVGPTPKRAGILSRSSHRAIHEERTIERGVGVMGVKHGDPVPEVASRIAMSNGARTSLVDVIRSLPLPSLSFPARKAPASVMGTPVRWERSHQAADGGGVRAEMSGVGDAPPSETRIIKDGVVIATIHSTWTLRTGSWELDRQEVTTPDGVYRDVIEIVRTGRPQGAALFRAGAFTARLGRSTNAAPILDPFAAAFDLVDCTGYDGSDECAIERNNVDNATTEANISLGLMILACGIPEPFEPATCNLAIANYLAHLVVQENAKTALKKCLDKQAQKARCCNAASKIPLGGPTLSRIPVSDAPSRDITGCESDPGTGGPDPIVICYYNIVYDTDTGEILEIWLDHCEVYES